MKVDMDALRHYLMDYCGTAMFSGFPAAFIDLYDIEQADGRRLCEIAEKLGVELRQFEATE